MTPEEAVKQILPDHSQETRDRLVSLIRAAYIRGQEAARQALPPEYWQIAGTLTKTFLTTLLGAIVANQGVVGLDWKAVIAAAVTSVAHTAYNFMNPSDARYGVGKSKE